VQYGPVKTTSPIIGPKPLTSPGKNIAILVVVIDIIWLMTISRVDAVLDAVLVAVSPERFVKIAAVPLEGTKAE
jgi:hypothetical protein